jgi:hypothetical protein
MDSEVVPVFVKQYKEQSALKATRYVSFRKGSNLISLTQSTLVNNWCIQE